MSPSNKNSKKLDSEIKNTIFSETERFELFFAQHRKSIFAAAMGIVVVITAAFAAYIHLKQKAEATAEELAKATTVAELQSVIEKHSGATGIEIARYRLAGQYIYQKAYDKALKELAIIISGDDQILRNKAQMLEAYTLEFAGKTADAAQKFANLNAMTELTASARAEAAYGAGRLFAQLGRNAEAKKILESVATLNLPVDSQSANYWRDNALELAKIIK